MVNFAPDVLVKFLRKNLEDLATLNQLTQQKRDKGEKVEELTVEADYDNDGKLDRFYPDKTILAEYSALTFVLPTTPKGELVKGENYQILKSLGIIDDKEKIIGNKSIFLGDQNGNQIKDPNNPNKRAILLPGQIINAASILKAREEVIQPAKPKLIDTEIEKKAEQFLYDINSSIPLDGNELVALLAQLKQDNKLESFLEIIKTKSEGKSFKELISTGEFNQADLERINDVLDGTNSFGNSDKGTYFSNGVQNWFTGLVRGVGTLFTNPSKVFEEVKKNPSSAIAIGLTLVGAGVAIVFPPVGAALAIAGLGMAAWKFLSNGIKAISSEDKTEAANAALESGSGLVDTVSSLPGTGQSLKQLKFSASVLRTKGLTSAARTTMASVEAATSSASQASRNANVQGEVNSTAGTTTSTQVQTNTTEVIISDNQPSAHQSSSATQVSLEELPSSTPSQADLRNNMTQENLDSANEIPADNIEEIINPISSSANVQPNTQLVNEINNTSPDFSNTNPSQLNVRTTTEEAIHKWEIKKQEILQNPNDPVSQLIKAKLDFANDPERLSEEIVNCLKDLHGQKRLVSSSQWEKIEIQGRLQLRAKTQLVDRLTGEVVSENLQFGENLEVLGIRSSPSVVPIHDGEHFAMKLPGSNSIHEAMLGDYGNANNQVLRELKTLKQQTEPLYRELVEISTKLSSTHGNDLIRMKERIIKINEEIESIFNDSPFHFTNKNEISLGNLRTQEKYDELISQGLISEFDKFIEMGNYDLSPGFTTTSSSSNRREDVVKQFLINNPTIVESILNQKRALIRSLREADSISEGRVYSVSDLPNMTESIMNMWIDTVRNQIGDYHGWNDSRSYAYNSYFDILKMENLRRLKDAEDFPSY